MSHRNLIAILILHLSFTSFASNAYLDCTPSIWEHGDIKEYKDIYKYQQKYDKDRFFRFFLNELQDNDTKNQGLAFLYYLFHKEKKTKLKFFYNTLATDIFKKGIENAKFKDLTKIDLEKKINISKNKVKELCLKRAKINALDDSSS